MKCLGLIKDMVVTLTKIPLIFDLSPKYSRDKFGKSNVAKNVDVYVTAECIHLYISCIVPRCLFQEVFVM